VDDGGDDGDGDAMMMMAIAMRRCDDDGFCDGDGDDTNATTIRLDYGRRWN